MKNKIALGAGALLNAIFSFLFQWYLVLELGFGPTTDAYYASIVVPQLVVAIISGTLMSTLVPLLSVHNDLDMQANAWRLLYIIGAALLTISFIIIFLSEYWIPMMVPGFPDQLKILTINLTQIHMLGVFIVGVNAVQVAFLSAKNKFVTVELAQLTSGIMALFFLYFYIPYYGVYAAALAVLIRPFILFLLLMPQMGCPTSFSGSRKTTKIAWSRLKPLLFGAIYYKSDLLVDRYLLSSGASGTLTLYNLAQQMYGAVAQLMSKAITAPIVPVLSRLHATASYEELQRKFFKTFRLLLYITCIGIIVNIFFGRDILNSFMHYGNISSEDVVNLWWVTLWLTGQLVGAVVGQAAASAFYAVGDTKTPAKISIFTFTIYLPLKIIAFNLYGIKGLALITSTLFVIDCIILTRVFTIKYFRQFKFNMEKS